MLQKIIKIVAYLLPSPQFETETPQILYNVTLEVLLSFGGLLTYKVVMV